MFAVKSNRQYTINETDVKSFANEGYDIYDEKGKLVTYGKGKTVPYEKYAALVEECDALRAEIKSLKAKKKG